MTEQELRESLISVAPSAIYANESEIVAIVEIAKAYADARESKEIAELKATNNLSSIGWRKDCEARDLKIDQLNAEIKRLRQGISLVHGLKGSMLHFDKTWGFKMLKYLLTGKERGGQCARLLEESIPPPVTESRHPIALQMYKCNNCQWRGQVGESIETETCDVCPECKSEDLLLYNENEDQE